MRLRILSTLLLFLCTAVFSPGHAMLAGQANTDDQAWARLRSAIPANDPLYRPTWLPDRFRQPAQFMDDGLFFGIRYANVTGDALFIGRVANTGSCLDTDRAIESLLIQGNLGVMTLPLKGPGSGCQLNVTWKGPAENYRIYVHGGTQPINREEMLYIIAGLGVVGPAGNTLPQPGNSATDGATCVTETNQCLAGPFLDYWLAHGGLARNGYPLTGEMVERLEDGHLYQVQYFERVRLEWHSEIVGTDQRVLLGQFGRTIYTSYAGRGVDPAVARKPGAQFFQQTGHNVEGRFLEYWQQNGGLVQFGYPLTEPIKQQLAGVTYTVQYFERARFELHPENAAPYDLLLGQFGRQILGTP